MILEQERPSQLLLDTCAIIFLFNGEPIAQNAIDAIDNASVLVSPVSAWEIGILGQRRSLAGPMFLPDPSTWFRHVLAKPSVSETTFDTDIALASCVLPDPLHRDPADRFLIATARRMAVPLVTRDRLILAYAARNHLDAIAC